ncbi:MAG TPA: asparagine synthase (glutamine-hydrolyzing) [Vicinamibacterales bacterium]|jgi:asparagine synthase (glutamine-hydrolysing)|nr:asparagine synthase (glutamine-hydrolyzing) [Vicinamibacterales bacterium]
MCGIAGRVNYLSRRPVDAAVVRRMCDLIAHRGPDGWDVRVDGWVGLGHRRLSIIDLSAAGTQPMSTADGRVWITFNGEIYNFLELRRQLEQEGHRFRSATDTEVILAAYRQYGLECLSRLRGMFAFAIWDQTRERLFLARDRVGKKPLQYLLDRDGIAFASEPKAFLADPAWVPEPDPQGIADYIALQYVPAPESAFKGVRKLPPGHFLLVENGQIRIERYWRLKYSDKVRMTEADAAAELRRRLSDAVRMRLISDVPLGAFLSGGIDSGAVVALMAEHASGPVKTFSIGFEQKEYDELPAARLVARKYSTDHHEFVVRPDALSLLPSLVWHYNEPYADSSAIPTFVLSELTRRYVTVALNGDGGDENFAGYDRYYANVLGQHFDRIPRPVRRLMANAAAMAPSNGNRRGLVSRGRRFLQAGAEGREERYIRWVSHFPHGLREEICTPDFLAQVPRDPDRVLLDAYRSSDAADIVDATLDVDVTTYLAGDLLVKVDIATMAHGLEGRSPLLDHEVMEFAARLPSDLKLRRNVKKYILRTAVASLLPAEILDRPKMGFGVPIDAWFRCELKEFVQDIVSSAKFRQRGIMRPAVVEQLFKDHVSGEASWHYQLWNVVMLEMWFRAFIDTRPTSKADVASSLGGLVAA